MSLDRLIAQYSPSMAHNREHGVTDAERLWQASRDGAIVPGMSVEISGPPGGGKTAMATALAINARLAEDEKNSAEVLVVGESAVNTPCSLHRHRRGYHTSDSEVSDHGCNRRIK